MTIYHSDLHKRKRSGGRKRPYRGRRRFEFGGTKANTVVGESNPVRIRTMGGNHKVKLLRERYVNLSDRSGKAVRTEILSVVDNPASTDLKRRGIMTKGTIIQTAMGRARITSRPGQCGAANAVLVSEE